MPVLLDVDTGQERILKQFIDGPTVYELALKDGLRKTHMDQILEMCQLLYPQRLNIDYFPTNFVDENGILYYIDYECNQYDPKWNFANWGIQYWSRTQQFMEYAVSRGDI